MPPKRGRGRPRKLSVSLKSRDKLVFEKNDGTTNDNVSNEVIEQICSVCDKSFKNTLALSRHICVCNDNSGNTILCNRDTREASKGILNGLTGSQDNLKVNKPKLRCVKCSKVFVFLKSYSKHMQNEHSDSPNSVSCDLCEVTCPNKRILTKHMERKHNSNNSYACEFCGKKFVRKAHVSRHLSQRGCDGRDLFTFPCSICNAQFTRKDNLMVHLRLQHITKSAFLCKQCHYYTRNFSKLIIHTQKNHYPKPLQFECDHCGKVTSSRASLSKHLEIHGEKKYACGVCGYRTFTVEVMRRHTLTHVQDKPYKCQICDRSYIQRAQLVKHLEKHSDYTCKTCDMRFELKNDLIIHEKLHDGTNNLQCTFENCEEKQFNNSFELQNHMDDHMKVIKCEICNKTFKNMGNMVRHVSTHMLERPRRCMYCVCARAYLRGEHLVRHVRKHHAPVFRQRLMHVRKVLGSNATTERVTKSEIEAILNMLDAESERIIEDYGTGVLYGGLQEVGENETVVEVPVKGEPSPLLSEEELAENLKQLLSKLIDNELLGAFGWPDDAVDDILERVIENCGARVADREKWSRVQRLRENAKHLFLYVVEDENIAKMLSTRTIDQLIVHILEQVNEDS